MNQLNRPGIIFLSVFGCLGVVGTILEAINGKFGLMVFELIFAVSMLGPLFYMLIKHWKQTGDKKTPRKLCIVLCSIAGGILAITFGYRLSPSGQSQIAAQKAKEEFWAEYESRDHSGGGAGPDIIYCAANDCDNIVWDDGKYCSEHRCEYSGCTNKRVSGSKYCSIHVNYGSSSSSSQVSGSSSSGSSSHSSSSNGSTHSTDPDDYDVEGYYEDNQDIFEDYDEAYDDFEDNLDDLADDY